MGSFRKWGIKMLRKYAFMIAAVSILLAPFYTSTTSHADSPQTDSTAVATEKPDGLQIMTRVHERTGERTTPSLPPGPVRGKDVSNLRLSIPKEGKTTGVKITLTSKQ